MRVDQLNLLPNDYTGKYLTGAITGQNMKFSDILTKAMTKAEEAGIVQDNNKDLLLSGEVNNLHEIPIALTESELTLNLAIQIRTKVIEAYTEIMRMQV